jgi:hypothetical protein
MAQTTTKIAACNAVVEIDNTAGSVVNISGSTNKADLSLSKDIGEGTTFEGDYKLRTECKRDASLSISIIWSTALGEARDLLEEWFDLGGSRTISVYPNGTTIGSRFYTGEWKLSGLSIPIDSSSADPIKIDIDAVVDGAFGFLNVGS